MFHYPQTPVPNQPSQQQQERRLSKRQGERQITWEHGAEDATNLLRGKVDKVREKGQEFLVGEIANLIAENIYKNPAPNYEFDEISFCPNNRQNVSDIHVNYGTYVNIIEEMVKNGEANHETAEKILDNLSKKYIPLESAAYEFFADIPRDSGARKLMAVLICETIRCNDDGYLR